MAEVHDFEAAKRAARAAAEAEQNPFGRIDYKASWVDVSEPQRWIFEDLEIGPGRPCGLIGYGSTGKSYLAIAMVICVATGRFLFGKIEPKKGRAAYLSYEMGRRTCVERFRRMANGLLCEPEELVLLPGESNPTICVYPKTKLNDPNALDAFCKEFEKYDLVVLDSLRRSIPGEDENDSKTARHLQTLADASEKTGTTYLVLHHTGKEDPRSVADGKKTDKRTSGRGSSALFDGSGSIWMLEGQGKSPRKLHQTRSHDDGDGISEEYRVELVPLSLPNALFHTLRPSLRLQLVDGKKTDVVTVAFDRVKKDILSLIEGTPGLSSNALFARLKGGTPAKRQALLELEDAGKVILRDGPRGSKLCYPATSPT